ncbi:MAG: endo alpha-1,4 polygalactosaminidase [Spirochaetales bacterium]|nr:endo alpha-1,4 polygalactosaminidase [Spirochaetales bacterium]
MKNTIVFFFIICIYFSCGTGGDGEIDPQYRELMRTFIIEISDYAHLSNADFIVIPQNGNELLTLEPGDPESDIADAYIAAIDGQGQEDLFYGYNDDNIATPSAERDAMIAFLDLAEENGVAVLVTDYCFTQAKMDDSYSQNDLKGYASFAADHRELNNIPSYPATPNNENSTDITSLSAVKNFLYLINPSEYADGDALVAAIQATNYDLILIDPYDADGTLLSPAQVSAMKTKANGSSRLVIAYMSIGEAEDYRPYWDPAWNTTPPEWLGEENPDWEGNYIVHYWEPDWQAIIYGSPEACLDKIINAGFDGVYLDIIEAYESFE